MTLHTINDPGLVWYGGIGHKLLSIDGGVTCFRCGMAADESAYQELVPDCAGPYDGGDHHWIADGSGHNECAYGDATSTPDEWPEIVRCIRD